MFYSHESRFEASPEILRRAADVTLPIPHPTTDLASVLTSRQHGVATIWLIATLGAKSTLKKVTRKAILEVDVPKACETIQDPSAPMALRLQGNLLYGVSRVYSQQCGYVLADTQSFRDKMKDVVVILKELETDPDTGKARPELLNLPDDPAYLPDFDMNLDWLVANLSDDVWGPSCSLTPPSSLSSLSAEAREPVHEPILLLPSADTPLGGDLAWLGFEGDASEAITTASRATRALVFEDIGMIEDPGYEFGFDAEGNLVEQSTKGESEPAAPSVTRPASQLGSDSALRSPVRQRGDDGLQGAQVDPGVAFGGATPFVFGDEDDPPLPEALPFSPALRLAPTPAEQAHPSSYGQPEEEAPSPRQAAQRKARAPKVLQPDARQELANADLAQWNSNYLSNMAEAVQVKQQHKAGALAKKNAAFWVAGQGIAGVGIRSGDGRVPNPLQLFSGQALVAALTGREALPTRIKRTRSLSDGLSREEESRRVKVRREEELQRGRGDPGGSGAEGLVFGDDDAMMFPGDDMDIEIGRHAPESLHGDHSSHMPWHASASYRGSARPVGSGLPSGVGSNVGGPGASVELGPPSTRTRRGGSRRTSASPLLGRGGRFPRYSSLELSEQPKLAGGEVGERGTGLLDDRARRLGDDDDDFVDDPDFQLYGPAAAVDTQTAAQSQWVASALDAEAHNFLAFLRAEIDAKIVAAERAGGLVEDDVVDRVTFDGLLPPAQHSTIVAAQGLLHVLSLATKGLLQVMQQEAFGTIEIGVVAGVEGKDKEGYKMPT